MTIAPLDNVKYPLQKGRQLVNFLRVKLLSHSVIRFFFFLAHQLQLIDNI